MEEKAVVVVLLLLLSVVVVVVAVELHLSYKIKSCQIKQQHELQQNDSNNPLAAKTFQFLRSWLIPKMELLMQIDKKNNN